MISIFQLTCLKPAYPLRRQLLLSFGIPAFLTIALVVSLAATFAHIAGKEVQHRADRVLREQVTRSFASSSSYIAEQITAYVDSTEGALQLMVEATRDRIVGYPYPGWETDKFVPFFDTESQSNKYPLRTPPPPLDWNFTANVHADNLLEHFQNRLNPSSPAAALKITTASGVYHFQGSCDPSEDETAWGYYPGCTAAHGNITTGGVVQPTATNPWLHAKSGDLVTIFKPIIEAQPDILLSGVYFVNSGAGSTLWYPGHPLSKKESVSSGCEWMAQNINPHTNEPYLSQEEVERCHPKGDVVPIREYNPVETDWFRECVERHEEFPWIGPFDALEDSMRALSLCRSVFDRISGALIGVIAVDVDLNGINEVLRSSRLYNGTSEIAIVRYDDGSIFADTNNISLTGNPGIQDIDFVSEDDFAAIKNVFDFSQTNYTKNHVLEVFQNYTIATHDGGILIGFPLPLPPTEYDPSYIPTCMVLHFTPSGVFGAVEEMSQRIDEDFLRIAVLSTLMGILGMLAVFVIVWAVSCLLTQPLRWIERVAWNIVNHKDERASDKLLLEADEEIVSAMKYSPRTEITDLVSEFHSMVRGFSGKGASTVAQSNLAEVANDMTWRSDFQQLYAYTAKKTKPFRTRATTTGSATSNADEDTMSDPPGAPQLPPPMEPIETKLDDLNTMLIVPAPPKKNLGGNVVRASATQRATEQLCHQRAVSCRSSLFWWILALIGIPILLTNAVICGLVSIKIMGTVPDWVTIVEEASLELEYDSMQLSAYLKSWVAETRFQEVSRDLHIMTRMAGWLLFGGIQRSDALVDMDEATEDCKSYPFGYTCPFFTSGRSVCSCEWQDVKHKRCTNFNETTNTRALQRRFWFTQARDADNVTGARFHADSFPEFDNMPNRTLWWNTTSDLPGAFKGSNASGHETSYDRIRVSSAMAVVDIPLYNYGRQLRRPKHDVGAYLGFEADGTFTGYDGCDFDHAFMAYWSSQQYNRAAQVAPDLCPEGKFGYDSRCRDWYKSGKDLYMDEGSHLYISAPYVFSSNGKMASSATSPIANPENGDYVGQALLDFAPVSIRDALVRLKEELAFMITPGYDGAGGDTVVGPNRPLVGWESANILDLLFPGTNVTSSSTFRDFFERNILLHMKSGGSNVTQFRRPSLDGSPEKLFLLAYQPVHTYKYEPFHPDDFSRGVNVSEHLVYSVGVATCYDNMRRPFQEIEDDVLKDLERLRTMYLSLVAFVTFIFAIYTCLVDVSITRSLITLLKVVKTINDGEMDDDLPPLKCGCREVNQIYNSLAKLIKIVRMSNIAFFSGNLDWAHDIIADALKLFRKVGDKKAIGVACNNLGNTLHAMAQEAGSMGEMSSDSDTSLLHKYEAAMSHFNEAVEIGQSFFNQATDEGDKAAFAEQLANRLFNRALFNLLAFANGTAPDGARDAALEDLERVQEVDSDVRDFWLERKLLLKHSGRYYGRLLRRIHGLIDIYDYEDVRAIWDPKQLIDEADQILVAAWNEPGAGLFQDLTPIGRLQQLEDAAMRLDLLQDKNEDAARLAMRMFAEDEYILETSFASATRSLDELMHDEASESWNPKTKSYCRQDLRRMLRTCKNLNLSLGKSVIFGLEINERFEGDSMLEKVNENCLRVYDTFCSDDDHVDVVAYTVNGDLNVELGKKEDNVGRQRAGLEMATTATSDRVCPALPYATQMIIDCAASSENDSYIILIADGYSWDPASHRSVRDQIQRLNQERTSKVHLLILGLDVEEPEVVDQYKAMCTLSKQSLYMDIPMEGMDATFRMVGSILSGRNPAVSRQSLTMEKF